MQYLHWSIGDEVEFLPADKHKRFLQDDSITLGVISQTGSKYQQQLVYNTFAISQGNHEGRYGRFFQTDTIILGVCGQACPNYLK